MIAVEHERGMLDAGEQDGARTRLVQIIARPGERAVAALTAQEVLSFLSVPAMTLLLCSL